MSSAATIGRGDRLERHEGRHGDDRAADPEQQQHRLAPEPVGERAEYRLHRSEPQQRGGDDIGRRRLVEPDGVEEEFLHVAGVGIGREPAARRQHADEDAFAAMLFPQQFRRRYGAVDRLILERRRLGQIAAQHIDAEREQRADDEGDAPAPGGQLGFGEEELQHDSDERSRKAGRRRASYIGSSPRNRGSPWAPSRTNRSRSRHIRRRATGLAASARSARSRGRAARPPHRSARPRSASTR
jgi:hypothetical protein